MTTTSTWFYVLHEREGDERVHLVLQSADGTDVSEHIMQTSELNESQWVVCVPLRPKLTCNFRFALHNDKSNTRTFVESSQRQCVPRGVEMHVANGNLQRESPHRMWHAQDVVLPHHTHIRVMLGGVTAPFDAQCREANGQLKPAFQFLANSAPMPTHMVVSSDDASNEPSHRVDLTLVHEKPAAFFYTTQRALRQLHLTLEFFHGDVLLARSWLMGGAMRDGDGFLHVPMLAAGSSDGRAPQLVGELVVYFVVVTSYAPRTADISQCVQTPVLRQLWKSAPTEDVGHRGSGAHGARSSSGSRTWIEENTILSFNNAARNQLPFIEFDVQLTKDGVPVIWHDFEIRDSYDRPLPIYDLTYKQFKTFHLQQYERSHGSTHNEDDAAQLQANRRRWASMVHDKLTSLDDIFCGTPVTLGYDIELKYPNLSEMREQHVHMPPRNVFVDAVLDVVFSHLSHNRRIFFSSFDPDLCLLLHQKQTVYPVFFLTEAGYKDRNALDIRTANIDGAVRFARRCGLFGIVSRVTPLLADPTLIDVIKHSGLLLGTFGWENNDIGNVTLQEQKHVDFVVSDHLATLAARKLEMQKRAAALAHDRTN